VVGSASRTAERTGRANPTCALASAGTELRLANGVTLLSRFDGEFASRASTYAGTGTMRYTCC
jgi:hypothetical protein